MNQKGLLEADLKIFLAHIHYEKHPNKDQAQLSLINLGDMNNEVKEVSIHDNFLDIIFDINGFDMQIHIEETDGGWQGTADLPSADFHVEFTPKYISNEPKFDSHHYIIPSAYVENLKANNCYQRHAHDTAFEYALNDPDVLAYIQEKGIIAENHHDLNTIRLLMKQTSLLIHQDGVNYCHDRENIGTIAQMNHAFKQDNKTNCRGMAIIMQGILRAYGFKANIVTCFPLDPEDMDCHVVCEVWVEELGKTVMLDPSANLMYFKNGIPLNLMELREAISKDETDQITINEDAARDGEPVELIQMLAYMSKNLFYLVKSVVSNETLEATKENSICLTSENLIGDAYPEAGRYTSNSCEFYL